MAYLTVNDKTLARQGLFGSQARPGMNPRRAKPRNAGSLSGTCLGDDTFVDMLPTPDQIKATADAAQAQAKSTAQVATAKKVAVVGGVVLVAYLLLKKKGGASATVAVPAVGS